MVNKCEQGAKADRRFAAPAGARLSRALGTNMKKTMKNEIDALKLDRQPLTGNCSGVYFLFDEQELVYVGEGWNCFLRVAEHTKKDSDKVFVEWSFIEIGTEKERKRLEREVISRFKPKYNKGPYREQFMNNHNGKVCSICGKWHRLEEYTYGNRPNRSYCKKCNKEEREAYRRGGTSAAREYRENERSKWKSA